MIFIGFGNPGAGKTTLVAKIAHNNEKRKKRYYKKNNRGLKGILFRWLSKPIEYREEFYCNYREKIDGKWVEYAKMKQNGYGRKDINRFWRFVFDLLFPKNFYDVIYCTDPTVKNTIHVTYDILGKFKPTWNSLFLCDEAGLGVANRNWKALPEDTKALFAKGRHSGADIGLISQTTDIDISARRRCELMFIMNRLGPITTSRVINFKVGVDKETKDLKDMYKEQNFIVYLWQLLWCMIRLGRRKKKLCITKSLAFFRFPYYNCFDSYHDDHVYTCPDPYQEYLKDLNRQLKEDKKG